MLFTRNRDVIDSVKKMLNFSLFCSVLLVPFIAKADPPYARQELKIKGYDVVLIDTGKGNEFVLYSMVPYGFLHDIAHGTPGLSHLTEHSPFRGSGRYPTEAEVDLRAKELGLETNAHTGDNATAYFVKGSVASLLEAVGFAAEFWTNPRLDPAFLEPESKVVIQECEDYRATDHEALQSSFPLFLKPGHFERVWTLGTPENLKSYVDDGLIQQAWVANYGEGKMQFVLAGNFSAEGAPTTTQIETAFRQNLVRMDDSIVGSRFVGSKPKHLTASDAEIKSLEDQVPLDGNRFLTIKAKAENTRSVLMHADLAKKWVRSPRETVASDLFARYASLSIEGSFGHTLIEKLGWATSFQVSIDSSGVSESLQVYLDLTELGQQNLAAVYSEISKEFSRIASGIVDWEAVRVLQQSQQFKDRSVLESPYRVAEFDLAERRVGRVPTSTFTDQTYADLPLKLLKSTAKKIFNDFDHRVFVRFLTSEPIAGAEAGPDPIFGREYRLLPLSALQKADIYSRELGLAPKIDVLNSGVPEYKTFSQRLREAKDLHSDSAVEVDLAATLALPDSFQKFVAENRLVFGHVHKSGISKSALQINFHKNALGVEEALYIEIAFEAIDNEIDSLREFLTSNNVEASVSSGFDSLSISLKGPEEALAPALELIMIRLSKADISEHMVKASHEKLLEYLNWLTRNKFAASGAAGDVARMLSKPDSLDFREALTTAEQIKLSDVFARLKKSGVPSKWDNVIISSAGILSKRSAQIIGQIASEHLSVDSNPEPWKDPRCFGVNGKRVFLGQNLLNCETTDPTFGVAEAYQPFRAQNAKEFFAMSVASSAIGELVRRSFRGDKGLGYVWDFHHFRVSRNSRSYAGVLYGQSDREVAVQELEQSWWSPEGFKQLFKTLGDDFLRSILVGALAKLQKIETDPLRAARNALGYLESGYTAGMDEDIRLVAEQVTVADVRIAIRRLLGLKEISAHAVNSSISATSEAPSSFLTVLHSNVQQPQISGRCDSVFDDFGDAQSHLYGSK